MDKLTFYHQKRRDGGIRTGIDLNDERLLEQFIAGTGEPDSALDWYVDVRASGDDISSNPEAIRSLFLEKSPQVQSSLQQLAKHLELGVDAEFPRPIPVTNMAPLTHCEIYYSATRRTSGREMSRVIAELAEGWPEVIQRMPAYALSHPVHG